MSKPFISTTSTRFFTTIHHYYALPRSHNHHTHIHPPPPRPFRKTPVHPTPPPSHRHTSTTSTTSPPPLPPTTPHFYNLFPRTLPHGPPPSGPFPINPSLLKKEFLTLQAQAHPDRHPSSHKARAEATSAHINDAYTTLLSPLKRAQYLLSLRGIDVAGDEGMKIEDAELLGAVMEVREAVEGAQEEAELEAWKRENEERISGSEGVLAGCFERGDVEGAKREAVRLRYWVNVKESLEGWERGKGVVLQH